MCVWLGAAWVEKVVTVFGLGCVDGEWVGVLDQGLDGWCNVCVSCESGFFV